MPGTTSTGMPAARQASISSAARPNTIGSPPFSRTTRWPSRASFTISALMSSCRQRGAVAGLADQHAPGLAPRQLQDLRADQAVVENDVGRLQGAQRLRASAAPGRRDRRRPARPTACGATGWAARSRPARRRGARSAPPARRSANRRQDVAARTRPSAMRALIARPQAAARPPPRRRAPDAAAPRSWRGSPVRARAPRRPC